MRKQDIATNIGIKQTTFTSDECQALLDLFDKACKARGTNIICVPYTDEERAVFKKLTEAGAFYVPKKKRKANE